VSKEKIRNGVINMMHKGDYDKKDQITSDYLDLPDVFKATTKTPIIKGYSKKAGPDDLTCGYCKHLMFDDGSTTGVISNWCSATRHGQVIMSEEFIGSNLPKEEFIKLYPTDEEYYELVDKQRYKVQDYPYGHKVPRWCPRLKNKEG
jgi:hypothetical protein